MLGIPDSKLVLVGIAVGYPDWDNPINEFRSDREAVESVVKWHGFD
jgi:nitroreductase